MASFGSSRALENRRRRPGEGIPAFAPGPPAAAQGIYVLRGDLDGAMRLYQEALERFERLGDLRDKAVTLGMRGQALWAQGKRGEAIASLWSGLELLMRLGIEPQTRQAMASDLARWRGELGAEAFDRLWRQVTGQPVPDWLARP
jgi:tetratricopeptide (TPR) repeat protein